MRRDLFAEDHEAFRELSRDFVEKEVVPAYPEWEKAGQAMLDRAIALHVEGELSAADAARVKLFCTEMQARVVDRCLQLFGGYGYMMEYPIARLCWELVARLGHRNVVHRTSDRDRCTPVLFRLVIRG
jgi:alkylation response protein AidB-like acyl-CoA dehydrogenase